MFCSMCPGFAFIFFLSYCMLCVDPPWLFLYIYIYFCFFYANLFNSFFNSIDVVSSDSLLNAFRYQLVLVDFYVDSGLYNSSLELTHKVYCSKVVTRSIGIWYIPFSDDNCLWNIGISRQLNLSMVAILVPLPSLT